MFILIGKRLKVFVVIKEATLTRERLIFATGFAILYIYTAAYLQKIRGMYLNDFRLRINIYLFHCFFLLKVEHEFHESHGLLNHDLLTIHDIQALCRLTDALTSKVEVILILHHTHLADTSSFICEHNRQTTSKSFCCQVSTE